MGTHIYIQNRDTGRLAGFPILRVPGKFAADEPLTTKAQARELRCRLLRHRHTPHDSGGNVYRFTRHDVAFLKRFHEGRHQISIG